MQTKLPTPRQIDSWPELTAPGFRDEVYRRAGLPLPEWGAAC